MRRINPEMVILAREARGMTQSALAKALNRTQGNLSKWESGFLEFPDDIADSLAAALDFPVSFFVQTDVRYGFGSSCFYHRKRQTMPVGELRTIKAHLNIFRMQIQKMLAGVEIERENLFFRLDIQDVGSPAAAARAVRSAWKLPVGPVTDLVGAVELAGGIIFGLPFGTTKLDAVCQWVPGAPPLFFLNCEAPVDRQRYTLAHELGHVFMHQIPTETREMEADEFAAEFLMPASDIRNYLKPLSLAKLAGLKPHWKVSMAALAKRAHDLGAISDRQYRSLYIELGKHGYRLREPVELRPERPTIVGDLVRVHLNEHGYSVSELASMLSMLEGEFRQYYMPGTLDAFRVVS